MRLREVIAALEQLAPPKLAESWDNTGLLLGDRNAVIERVLTCLTLTPDVAEEAVRGGVQLVVTHHPVMFKAVQRLTADRPEARSLLVLARHGIAVYSPHTAWDNAPTGINQQLADRLQLTERAPLRPHQSDELCTIVTYVPQADLEPVQKALWSAGCGDIGDYRNCSFYSHGTGTFFGSSATHPTVGQAGRLERADEIQLEVICPTDRVPEALVALRAAHSYEVPAVNIYPQQVLPDMTGAGVFGDLPEEMPLSELLTQIRGQLSIDALQWTGAADLKIRRLGISCGSAAEFWKDAQKLGCQALLTGEARFHTAVEARDFGFALILAGHYATERPGMEALAAQLHERCPELQVTASAAERDPLTAQL